LGNLVDAEECESLVIGEDEGAGSFNVDDLGELGSNEGDLLAWSDGPRSRQQSEALVLYAVARRGEMDCEAQRLATCDLYASDDRTRRRDDEDRPLGHSVDRIEDAEGGSDLAVGPEIGSQRKTRTGLLCPSGQGVFRVHRDHDDVDGLRVIGHA